MMIKPRCHKSLAATIGLIAVLPTSAAQAADLTVTISDIRGNVGPIEVQLFVGEEGWLKDDYPANKTLRKDSSEAVNGQLSLTFTDLAPGDYGFAVYHDENLSGKLEQGFMWRPKEGWAFSNNIKPRFGPPKFKKGRVEVTEDGTQTAVRLNYP